MSKALKIANLANNINADLVQGVPKDLLGIGGDGYSWYDETSNRAKDTTYTNTYGKPIAILIVGYGTDSNNGTWFDVYIDGVWFDEGSLGGSYSTSANGGFIIIPNGSTYKVSGTNHQIKKWFELK